MGVKVGLPPEEIEKLLEERPGRIIYVRNLVKYFFLRRSLTEFLTGRQPKSVKAVDGISFDVMPKEIFGLAGESGCGKTTTGKVIMRLYDPTAGSIIYKPSEKVLEEVKKLSGGRVKDYDGYIDIAALPQKWYKPLRKEIQMIFQDPYGALNPRMKIGEILEEPLLIHNIGTPEEREEMVMKALEDVKLIPPEDFVDRFPHMLSGGQRQRVAMARALIMGARFIVADEPVSMIDVSLRAELLNLMLELRERFGLTYLFITHDLALARYLCNRIAIMYLGKLVEIGDADDVIDKPLHPYTKALISAIPEPDPENRKRMRQVPIKGEVPSAVFVPSGCRFHPRCVVLDEHPELKDKCRRQEPPMVEVEPGRHVACWYVMKT